MPTYVYRRADGTRFEHQQRITADALTTCPTTGQTVTRVPSAGAGLVFKGSGFYQTDYVRPSSGGDSDPTPSEKKAETKSTESKGTESKDTAKDAAPKPASESGSAPAAAPAAPSAPAPALSPSTSGT